MGLNINPTSQIHIYRIECRWYRWRCAKFVSNIYDISFYVLYLSVNFILGGTFALYSLLCRHAKFSLLPNQQAVDEDLSSYKYGSSRYPQGSPSSLKIFLEKHKKSRTALLVVVLLGTSMLIGDGVISPSISGK